ncbi:MAG: hypothetical protein QG657_4777, partial [Acidobacteriota bacterium]|nr:hypothetical protein [Acidobacteriota bacterium]
NKNRDSIIGRPRRGLHHSSFIVHHSSHLAYIIYTSGSTGKPKGVMVEHRNVVRLVKNTNFVEFREGDRLLQTGALEFDASTFEIWGSLLNGMTLCVAGKDEILNPVKLKGNIRKYDVCTMWLTSPLFNQLVAVDVEIFSGLRNLLVGGDVLSPLHINRVIERFPQLNIINGYGPTENTTFSTTYRIKKQYASRIPIGKTISNSTAYVVDRAGHLAPVGIAGELLVGGDGVSRGYLNNPELTSRKFNRYYMSNKTYICYKTGDLARWVVDTAAQGTYIIEFLGRVDQQVKIRGFRIELGEIEAELLKHEMVKEVVVIDRKEESGEKYLCGYIVVNGDFNIAGLKEYLAGRLPAYMIPTYFMSIERIPLTVNGKVDRKALPVPEIKRSKQYEAAANEIEEKLARIWSEVLAIEKDKIGMNDDFFQLGGHSLKATILTAKIHKFFDVKIPLTQIFLLPTVRELGQYIKEAVEDKYLAMASVEKRDYYELSSAQQRLYILQQMDAGGSSYNVLLAYVLEGELDIMRLDTVFRKLIQRHESLRTSFIVVNDETVQRIHDEVEFKIEILDGRDWESCGSGIGIFIRPFELSSAPLMRVGVIKKTETRHVLAVDIHHIVTDGTSMQELIKEFKLLYMGIELPQLRVQYKDYAWWQRREEQKEVIRHQETYWLKQFSGEIPVLELPTDFPRPAVQSFEGHSLGFEISALEMKDLKKMAVQEGVTLYMVLQSVTNIFLAKLSNQEDIIIGTPTAGRRHADLERIIGMFVNTLAIRNFPVGEKRFTDFLGEVKERTLAAFENEDYQFEDLVEKVLVNRDMGRNPLFDVVFVLQNLDVQGTIADMNIPGLLVKPYASELQNSKFDITLSCFEGRDGLIFTMEYCTRLFKEETIKRFIGYYRNIISIVLANPLGKIADIEIITEEEKRLIMEEFNDTGVPYPVGKTIPELFESQVGKTPDRIAVFGHGLTRTTTDNHVGAESNSAPSFRHIYMSYRQLNEQSDQLAGLLIEKGVLADDIIGIMLERSIDMILGILGILKSGAAYLPIDPSAPPERVDYMLKDSGARILINKSEIRNPKSETNPNVQKINVQNKNRDSIIGRPRRGLHHSSFSIQHSNHLAYIIYTSGSTGKPKGVPISHANLSPLLHWGYRHLGLGTKDRFLQNLSYYFDWSVWEIFIGLTTGACLYMVAKELLLNPEACVAFMKQNDITVLHVTPTQYQFYLKAPERPRTLKYLFIGAEKLTKELVERSFESVNQDCRV